MTDKKPSVASGAFASDISSEPIKELNPNDVLLGRGNGSNKWIGNIQFRDLVKSRKNEYAYGKVRSKAVIADEIVKHISSKGGRFLRLDKDAKPVNIVQEGVWYECPYKVGLEKTKQALRENRDNNRNLGLTHEDMTSLLDDVCGNELGRHVRGADGTSSLMTAYGSLGLGSGMPMAALSIETAAALSALPPIQNLLPVLPPTLAGSSATLPAADAHLALFQGNPLAFHLYYQLGQACLVPGFASFHMQSRPPTGKRPQPECSVQTVYQQQGAQLRTSSRIQEQSNSADNVQGGNSDCSDVGMGVASMPKEDSLDMAVDDDVSETMQEKTSLKGGDSIGTLAVAQETSRHGNIATGVASVPKDDSAPGTGEDVSEFLLSVLALSGRQKFTEEQGKQEKASMTDDERARVLCDLFGKYCSTRQNKKARRDLSKDEVAFLVKQMRIEIEKFPDDKKDALIKAQAKCRAEEFSDARLERFLRCEGMDVKVRAGLFLRRTVIMLQWSLNHSPCQLCLSWEPIDS